MRGKSEYPPLHAGQHRSGGSDPLDAIIYDFENVGDWLNIEAGPPAGGEPTTEFSGDAQILIQSKGPETWLPIVLRVSQDDGENWSEFSVGYGVTDLWDSDFNVRTADGREMFAVQNNTTDPGAIFVVGGTNKLTVQNLSFQNVLEIRPDGTVHIQTGQTIIADL